MIWPLKEIQQAVEPNLKRFAVEVLPTVDSTNDELMRRAKSGREDSVLLLAIEQTAGKGRRGKVWHSKHGQSLTFSLGLHLTPENWSGLSLVVGLAILKALDPIGNLAIALKWPNDLWVGPPRTAKKLGGILIESNVMKRVTQNEGRYCVIGIGLNINAPQDVELKRPAIGINELDPDTNAQLALLKIVPSVIKYVLRFCSSGFLDFVEEYNSFDVLRGELVSMSNGVTGRAQGVNSVGELVILTGKGLVNVASDEVSLLGFES
jgi:BirA family biotin operon repressor/biotin-[acetyl-CoA-carboxylase] ligase